MSAAVGRTSTKMSGANFLVDPVMAQRNSGRVVDFDSFDDSFRAGAFTVQANGAAAQNATSMTVDALPGAVPAGARLFFAGTKPAITTAAAAAGATTLAVAALVVAIADNDAAIYFAPGATKVIPAGTPVGDLADANKRLRPRVVTSNPAIGLLATEAVEGDKSAALSGYGVIVGGAVYENLIPGATGSPAVLPTAVKNELNANGIGFSFEQFSDNRS